jgi:CRP-like cAMP-binding protein
MLRANTTITVTVDELRRSALPAVEPWLLDGIVGGHQAKVVAAKTLLVAEGEDSVSFFLLLKGSVKTGHESAEGAAVTARLVAAPAILGALDCLSGTRARESLWTLEKAVVLEVTRAWLVQALSNSPGMTNLLLQNAAAELRSAATLTRSMAFHPVETRLAQLVTNLVDMYGLPVADGVKIRIPLSQDDLADSLGVARRSITRAVRKWDAEGIIGKSGSCFVIKDLGRLHDYASPSEGATCLPTTSPGQPEVAA